MLWAKSSVVDISPHVSTDLGCGPGGAVPPNPNAGIEANILLLRDLTTDTKLLLMSVDSLYPGPRLRSELEAGLSEFLLPESIFLASSHTHAAPQLDGTKPILGSISETHFRRITSLLIQSTIAMLASSDWVEVSCRLSQFQSNSVAHRRRVVPLSPREKSISFFRAEFLPNLRKSKPVASELMEFFCGDKIYGALWIMPCHPISNPSPAEISADYVGIVRSRYRTRNQLANSELPFLFFQGASGDLRPPSFGLMPNKTVKGVLSNVIFGRRFRRFSEHEKEAWIRGLEKEMERRTVVAKPRLQTGSCHLATRRQEVPLDAFFESDISDRYISMHTVSIDNLTIFAVSGEPTWEVRTELVSEVASGLSVFTVVGCIDDTFGYMVSSRQARWGGYEVDGYLTPFSLTRKQGVEIEKLLGQALLGFARRSIQDFHLGGSVQTGRERPSAGN